jgi:hypothetical protein
MLQVVTLHYFIICLTSFMGALFCYACMHAFWRVHLVSSSRWTLEHILPCLRYLIVFFVCKHLGGHIVCGPISILTWKRPILVVRPFSFEDILYSTSYVYMWRPLLERLVSTYHLIWSTID